MTEKALVAVNDSKAALNAFLEALQLSRRFGFQLGAVCVAPPYQGDLALVGVRAIKRTLSEPSLTVLDEAIHIAAEDGVALVTFAASGSRCEAIIDLAVKEKYDLIIIGQAPRRRWSFVGSLTASLLRHSPVDILVIPKSHPVHLDRVLHVLNGSQPAFSVLKLVKMSARNPARASQEVRADGMDLPSPTTNGVCIATGRDAMENPFPEGLVGQAPGEVIVRERSPRRILELSRKIGIDLIVWEDGGAQKTAWPSFLGTRAFRFARQSRWPVWMVKA